MIKVDTAGIAAFRSQLKLERARLDREISQAFVGWTMRMFYTLVDNSPQWSGNLASNWNYSIKQPDYSYLQIANKTGDDGRIDHWRENQGVFQTGHPLAVQDAMTRMVSVTKGTWRDKVFITNATPSEAGSFLERDIEEGRVKIRPVNLVQGQVMLIDWLVMQQGGSQ